MRRFARNTLSLALVLALVGACGGDRPDAATSGSADTPTDGSGTPADDTAAPSMEEIVDATVHGIYDDPVRLTDGTYEGPPFSDDSPIRPTVYLTRLLLAQGDIDGDGTPESAALLEENSGGTGHFSYLAVFRRTDDGVTADDAVWLEDRIQVRSLETEGDRFVVRALAGGPGDAACCPTTWTRFEVYADGDSLAVEKTQADRVTLADLTGVTWRLERFSGDDPLPEEIEVTLQIAPDGAISGSAGCNGYQGQVTSDPELKSFEPGPIAATRRMCPPDIMEVETRFLSELGSAGGFGFSQGRLSLSVIDDDGYRSLFFDPS